MLSITRGIISTAAMLARGELIDALRENFSAVGPVSLMVGPEVPDPVEFSTRVYQHYLGDLTFDLDRMEDLTRVIACVNVFLAGGLHLCIFIVMS